MYSMCELAEIVALGATFEANLSDAKNKNMNSLMPHIVPTSKVYNGSLESSKKTAWIPVQVTQRAN